MIVFVAGGGILPGYYAELRFKWKDVSRQPDRKAGKTDQSKPRGTVLIKSFKVYTEGKPLIGLSTSGTWVTRLHEVAPWRIVTTS